MRRRPSERRIRRSVANAFNGSVDGVPVYLSLDPAEPPMARRARAESGETRGPRSTNAIRHYLLSFSQKTLSDTLHAGDLPIRAETQRRQTPGTRARVPRRQRYATRGLRPAARARAYPTGGLRASQRTVLHVQEAWPQQVRHLGRQVVVERPLPGLGISHAEAVDDLEHPAVEIHVCPGPHLLV